MKPWLAIFTVLVAVAGLRAEAVTGSSCTYSEVVNPITMQAPGLTCNLFPSTNTTGGVGTFQGNFVSISLSSVPGWSTGMEQGVGIGDGYLVVTNPGVTLTLNPDTGIFDDSNRADWLQVLEFPQASVTCHVWVMSWAHVPLVTVLRTVMVTFEPLQLSNAVGGSKVHGAPNPTVLSLAQVMTGGVVSTTVTIWLQVSVLPH